MHLLRSMFKRRLLPLACALALAGCLQVDQELTLNPDGSGHLSARYSLDPAQLATLSAAIAQAPLNQPGVPPAPDPATLFQLNEEAVRKEFRGYEEAGLTLQSLQVSESNGVRTVHVEIDFKTVSGLAGCEFFADDSLVLERGAAGRYRLRQAPPLQVHLAGGLRDQQAAVEAALNRLQRGFKARLRVTVPGDIVGTTADQRQGRTATWTFDAARDPQALARARRTALSVEFTGEGLTGLLPPSPAPDSDHGGGGRGGT